MPSRASQKRDTYVDAYLSLNIAEGLALKTCFNEALQVLCTVCSNSRFESKGFRLAVEADVQLAADSASSFWLCNACGLLQRLHDSLGCIPVQRRKQLQKALVKSIIAIKRHNGSSIAEGGDVHDSASLSLMELPDDLLHLVFARCDPCSLARAVCTCRHFANRIRTDCGIWRRHMDSVTVTGKHPKRLTVATWLHMLDRARPVPPPSQDALQCARLQQGSESTEVGHSQQLIASEPVLRPASAEDIPAGCVAWAGPLMQPCTEYARFLVLMRHHRCGWVWQTQHYGLGPECAWLPVWQTRLGDMRHCHTLLWVDEQEQSGSRAVRAAIAIFAVAPIHSSRQRRFALAVCMRPQLAAFSVTQNQGRPESSKGCDQDPTIALAARDGRICPRACTASAFSEKVSHWAGMSNRFVEALLRAADSDSSDDDCGGSDGQRKLSRFWSVVIH